jgi:hypothetical protein
MSGGGGAVFIGAIEAGDHLERGGTDGSGGSDEVGERT